MPSSVDRHVRKGHGVSSDARARLEAGSKTPTGKAAAGTAFPAGTMLEIPVFLRSNLTIGRNTLTLAPVPVNKQIKNGSDIVLQHTHYSTDGFNCVSKRSYACHQQLYNSKFSERK